MIAPRRTRTYSSPRRELQAAATRGAIRASAARLFERDGYVRTTIRAVADDAGVSAETVYSAFGNKRQLLREVIEDAVRGTDGPAEVVDDEWVARLTSEPDARRRLEQMTARTRGILDRSAALYEVVHHAARSDPGLRDLEAELDEQRRADVDALIGLLADVSPLRLERKEATDVVWALATSDLYLRLRRNRGWSADRADALLEDLIARVVLPSAT